MDPEPARNAKTSKSKNKKRFSDEQIRSLETMFGSEARPEPQAKQRIADQLGLNPRQVAIWFQNRRARCKLKQIEQDYRILKASYDSLAARFNSLKDEHHYLIGELQRLKGAEEGFQEATKFSFATNSFGREESNTRPHDVYAHDADEFRGEQGTEVLNMVETLSGSTLSSGNGYSLESVLEPDYLAEDKCDSEWWESY